MIPRSDLVTIRRRLAAAGAPAPWVLERDATGGCRIRTAAGEGQELVIWRDFEPASDADIEFIALARNLLDRLVRAADEGVVDLVTAEELETLELAARRATAAPWTPVLHEEQRTGASSFISVDGDHDVPDMYIWLGDEFAPTPEVDLIANVRQDVPRLVMELKRLAG